MLPTRKGENKKMLLKLLIGLSLIATVSTTDVVEVCSKEFDLLQHCLGAAQHAGDCPTGWTYFPKTHSCYYMLPDAFYSFMDAEIQCQKFGGHLASIHSATENRFASMLMEAPFLKSWQDLAWIGLKIENGIPGWTDNTPLDFTKWLEGEPNAGNGIYGVLLYANKVSADAEFLHHWDDIKGKSELRSGLCKKKVHD